MSFLTEDQNAELAACNLDYINDEVIPDIVTPLAHRDDIPELNNTLFENGILLLPDNEDAISEILDVIANYSSSALKICHRDPS